MIFNEASYFVILLFTVFCYYLLPRDYRAFVLIISGIIFYYFYAGAILFLFIVEAFLIYILILKSDKKLNFIFALSISLLLLFYYKYINMFLSPFITIHSNTNNYIIPLGISFFTFEFIHCIVDRKKLKLENLNAKYYMAFVMFFPTLVSGPIKRYQNFCNKFDTKFSLENIYIGLKRIILGLSKKIMLADNFSLISDRLTAADFNSHWVHHPKALWVGVIAYSFKIYFDFSGYSDIAIGSAKLFGITIPENFNFPYLKRNIGQFWKNWHISLYRWLVDYIFIPLGGSQVVLSLVILNTIIVMMISGLWHGANWNFVVWGAYHGFLLTVYRFYKIFFVDKYSLETSKWYNSPPVRVFSTSITFACVTLGWVLFACDLNRAIEVYKVLFLFNM